MRKMFDLNCAPKDQYPVIKILTKSDMTTSQLVLPRHSVEEFIVPNMPEHMRNRLRDGDGRANIWVVDDANCLEHYLTMVDRDHRYSIISWSRVRQSRELMEGQEMRFGWMLQKLHFIAITQDNDYSDEDSESDARTDGRDNKERAAERIGNDTDEPIAKRRRTDGVRPSS
ncbi:hypothetical protein vseg_010147 [Gypsophila vaccaria]